MSFAALAAVVVIGVFALTRTPSGTADAASTSGQTAGAIAADTSGSYSQLVQRANGLYDQGAQAFQKKQQSAGVQYFAAAAEVYRAAWKQQATDPNVGTDYATSLFYSGDTDGALRQVDEVLTKSPSFQTAHLNKGVYLQAASQTAKDDGRKAEADSLLAQARTEFEKAASIDAGEAQRRLMGGSGKIVVIDDEESVRDVVKAYLEKDGFTVYVAANGRDGLALAERRSPDLIVLDLDAARHLRRGDLPGGPQPLRRAHRDAHCQGERGGARRRARRRRRRLPGQAVQPARAGRARARCPAQDQRRRERPSWRSFASTRGVSRSTR